MTNSPLKNYGFTYKYNGKDFAFDVCAESEQEALARAAAMGSAELFGELKEAAGSLQAAGKHAEDGVLFEVNAKDGHSWRIHENGMTEGFPEGSLVINNAAPLMNALQGRIKRLEAALVSKDMLSIELNLTIKKTLDGWAATACQKDGKWATGSLGRSPQHAVLRLALALIACPKEASTLEHLFGIDDPAVKQAISHAENLIRAEPIEPTLP